MMIYEFTSFDGKKISVREWNEVSSPKGVIQISHGMAEHSGRYDIFAREMNARGYIVFADDHRAHGLTDKDTLGYSDGD
ncbi:MAG: alpha/beta hydrolase, partial [Clostridia bacterium]|nr:alpha/beta hydrolase [Clostridia bacterium]